MFVVLNRLISFYIYLAFRPFARFYGFFDQGLKRIRFVLMSKRNAVLFRPVFNEYRGPSTYVYTRSGRHNEFGNATVSIFPYAFIFADLGFPSGSISQMERQNYIPKILRALVPKIPVIEGAFSLWDCLAVDSKTLRGMLRISQRTHEPVSRPRLR